MSRFFCKDRSVLLQVMGIVATLSLFSKRHPIQKGGGQIVCLLSHFILVNTTHPSILKFISVAIQKYEPQIECCSLLKKRCNAAVN